MIKASQIPDEVVEEAALVYRTSPVHMTHDEAIRAAIAAGLAAWPGMVTFTHEDDPDDPPHIILPLPQEPGK